MKIWVSSLAMVHQVARDNSPARIVSLLGPDTPFPDVEGYGPDIHHRVCLDDDRKPIEGRLTPNEAHVSGAIDFLKDWNPDDAMLVHCWAGISRSSATAFIAAFLHNPDIDESLILDDIREASPTAFPNTRIVAIADDLMGRSGRMANAATRMCSDPDRTSRAYQIGEAVPFSIRARF
ncbi:tyrosine phosphatase family protein [Parvularcula sp. IMCC14364]|uniref:tyrosine phosphatase family protein n=1 Tax=Parvularcula sp. IMCC14364 TaxID=3067902 RepID=UPI0027415F73|nr:hypothetical protein [Parvularcula sp. IMCC14364]